MTLSNDIQDAIRKSLPEQTAAELKKYLEDAEMNKNIIKSQSQSIDTLSRQKQELELQLHGLRHLDGMKDAINADYKKIEMDKIEFRHQKEMNDIKIQAELGKTHHMMETMKIVFKSQPVGYAFATTKNESVQVPDPSNTYNSKTLNNNSSEYVTKKEITE